MPFSSRTSPRHITLRGPDCVSLGSGVGINSAGRDRQHAEFESGKLSVVVGERFGIGVITHPRRIGKRPARVEESLVNQGVLQSSRVQAAGV